MGLHPLGSFGWIPFVDREQDPAHVPSLRESSGRAQGPSSPPPRGRGRGRGPWPPVHGATDGGMGGGLPLPWASRSLGQPSGMDEWLEAAASGRSPWALPVPSGRESHGVGNSHASHAISMEGRGVSCLLAPAHAPTARWAPGPRRREAGPVRDRAQVWVFFSSTSARGRPSSRGSRYYLPTARRKLPARNRTGTRCAPRGGRAGDHSEEATERKIDGGGQNSCSVNQACFGLTSSRRRVSSTELTHWLFVYQPTTLINPVACGCPSPSLFSNTSMETETLSRPILQSAIAQHRNGCCPGSSSQPASSLLSVSPDGGPIPHLSPSLIVPGRRTPDLITAVRSARESVT